MLLVKVRLEEDLDLLDDSILPLELLDELQEITKLAVSLSVQNGVKLTFSLICKSTAELGMSSSISMVTF